MCSTSSTSIFLMIVALLLFAVIGGLNPEERSWTGLNFNNENANVFGWSDNTELVKIVQ